MKIFKNILIFITLIISTTCFSQPKTREETWQHYFLIKKEMLSRFENITKTKEFLETHLQLADGIYEIFGCGFTPGINFSDPSTAHDEVTNKWQADLFDTAKTIALARQVGTIANYPEILWKSDLIAYEEQEINDIWILINKSNNKPFLPLQTFEKNNFKIIEKLIIKLNLYRKNKAPNLPKLITADGCGAGAFGVEISTQPTAKIMKLMPDFFAKICEKTISKTDLSACPYWREFSVSSYLGLSGIYRYYVQWDDGGIRNGRVDFDKLNPENIDITKFIIKK